MLCRGGMWSSAMSALRSTRYVVANNLCWQIRSVDVHWSHWEFALTPGPAAAAFASRP